MSYSEKITKHRSVFQVSSLSHNHNPPGIDDFHIIKPISKGAFGQVFLARRRHDTKHIYAIKAMKKRDVLHKNMMEQVVAERDALAISSKSSYVVQLFYSFQDATNIFLVMEFMIGGDLKSLLHNLGCFSEDMAMFYVAEVTLALEYLHSHSIHHSDIKPDNMLLSASGHVKLTDFGLCTLPSENKPTVMDLVKHNTPCAQLSRRKTSKQLSNIYWRTPGQLQSLVSQFTFSSPREPPRSRTKSSNLLDSLSKVKMNFEFSSPLSRHSLNTTPCGRMPKSKSVLQSSLYEPNRVKKLSFASSIINTDILDEINMSRKRTVELANHISDSPDDLIKRARASLPVELDITKDNDMKENIPVIVDRTRKRSVVTFNTTPTENDADDCDISYPGSSDGEASIENMSVDTTVFGGDHTLQGPENISIVPENISDGPDDTTTGHNISHISGVATLSDTSMSCGNTTNDLMVNRSSSFLQESEPPLKWSQSSPMVSEVDTEDEGVGGFAGGFNTPRKNLTFGADVDEDLDMSTCDSMAGESKCESQQHDSTNEQLHNDCTPADKSFTSEKSYNVFEMQNFKSQTPFRTPKSCTRGRLRSNQQKEKVKPIRGTPDYLAPEILLEQGHGAPADVWALGVCFYEFVTGVPPFNDDTPDLVFQHILHHEIMWPEDEESLADATVETIQLLLSEDPAHRPTASGIKVLPLFAGFKWDVLEYEEAPFIPNPDDVYDTGYFDAKNEARQFKLSDFKI